MRKPVYQMILLVLVAANFAAAAGIGVMEKSGGDLAPRISFDRASLTASIHDDTSVLLQGVTAWDDHDGDLTGSIIIEGVSLLIKANTCKVTYTVVDSANQVTKADREIIYIDNEPPRFSLSTPLIFTYNSGFNLWDVISAIDSRGKNLSSRIKMTVSGDSSDINALGVWPVNLMVADDMGNTADLTLNVTVEQQGFTPARNLPVITLSRYLIYLPSGSAFKARDYIASVAVNQMQIPLTSDLLDQIIIESAVDTVVPGVYAVRYQYTSEDGVIAVTELVAVVME